MTKESKASSAKRTSLKLSDSTLLERPKIEVGDSTSLGALEKVVGEDSTLVGAGTDNFDSTSKQAEEGQVVEEDGRVDSTLSPTVGRVVLVHMPVHCTVQCICQLAG